jgi:hypothetical protein
LLNIQAIFFKAFHIFLQNVMPRQFKIVVLALLLNMRGKSSCDLESAWVHYKDEAVERIAGFIKVE